jgi:hypothetical protein
MTFNLGTRKLQRINTGYYVSAPSEWVNHHHLSKQSLIQIWVDEDGRLILEPKRPKNDLGL